MSPLELATLDGHRLPAPSVEDAALAVRGLTVSYGDAPALFSVDATFPAGAMSAIVGPNGAGKSTLLKAALGIVPRVSGTVTALGVPLETNLATVAYVPQRASVDWDFPVRVIDVVMMGLYREVGLLKRWRSDHRARALHCLRRVGMEGFAQRQIGALSGGQQQRVFLARALAQDAALVILDEPFAGVDAATERAIVEVLRGLVAQGGSVVAVHHDLSTVMEYFDHVLLVDGRAIAEGPVECAFTAEALQATYGGRLAASQVSALSA